MHKTFETIGSRLLGLFVPKIDAAASCHWAWKTFASCFQCDYRPCAALCAQGCGCDPYNIVCY